MKKTILGMVGFLFAFVSLWGQTDSLRFQHHYEQGAAWAYKDFDSLQFHFDSARWYANHLHDRQGWLNSTLYLINQSNTFQHLPIMGGLTRQLQDTVVKWYAGGHDDDAKTWRYYAEFYRGVFTYQIKDYTQAVGHFQASLGTLISFQDSAASTLSAMATTVRYLGAIEKARQRYQSAMVYFLQAAELNQKMGVQRGLMFSYKHLGDIHKELGNWDKSESYYEKAVDFFEEDYQRNPVHNRNILTSGCSALSDLYHRMQQRQAARNFMERALDLQDQDGPMYHRLLLSMIDQEIESDNYSEARRLLRQTFKWRKQRFKTGVQIAEVRQRFAHLAQLEGKGDLAEKEYLLCLSELGLAQDDHSQLPLDPVLAIETLSRLADLRASYALVKPQNSELLKVARDSYDQALAWLEQLRLSTTFEEDLIRLTELGYNIYEQALWLESHFLEDGQCLLRAWDLIERSHGMGLRRAGLTQNGLSRLSEEQSMRQRILALEQQQAYQAFLEALASGREASSAQSRWFRAQQSYQSWLESNQALLGAKTLDPTSLEKVLAELGDQRSMILYFTGEQHSFRLFLSSDQQVFARLPLEQDWPEQVLAFQRQVWRPFLGEESPVMPVSAREISGLQLFHSFIGEVESSLSDQVIVIPDGPLWNLPFDLLQVPDENSPYWIEKHAYSLAYSGSWWYELNANRRESAQTKGMLAMAPDFPLTPPPSSLLASRGFLGPLLNNRDEVLMLKDRYRAQVFLDEAANLNNFRAEAGTHRIIHLSTHGLAAKEDMALSFLAFAAPGDTLVLEQDSFPRIGALFAGELYQMQLDADLVVLSACETNVGISRKGEGVQSLSRGFFYAGARSLLASQWQVSDQSTRQLMEVFYQALDQGASKDEALRQAKLRLLEEGWEPYFWAGFNLIGQAQPVQLYVKRRLGWLGMAIAGLAILLGLGLVRRKRLKAILRDT